MSSNNAAPAASPAAASAAPANPLHWWAFESLSVVSWGHYGLVLSISAAAMGGSRLAALCFVCLAYGMCIAPSVYLAKREPQRSIGGIPIDNPGGATWGIAAGLSGFLGALFLVLSLSQGRGVVMLAMPLVFAAAPLTNALYSVVLKRIFTGKWVIPNKMFLLGIAVIGAAAYWVLKKRPVPPHLIGDVAGTAWFWYALGTAVCWGTYGPHNLRSMQKFGGSPARTLIGVCITYVAGGLFTFTHLDSVPDVSTRGVVFGLLAGLLGFGGAVGVAYVNRVGMKLSPQRGPLVNMPLIFGCASVVSVIASIAHSQPSSWAFLPSFLGAVLVLISGMVLVLRNNPAH